MSAVATQDGPSRELLHRQMDIEFAKLLAEISKITAEASRINREAARYPWLPILTTVLGSAGLIGAIIAIIVAVHG